MKRRHRRAQETETAEASLRLHTVAWTHVAASRSVPRWPTGPRITSPGH